MLYLFLVSGFSLLQFLNIPAISITLEVLKLSILNSVKQEHSANIPFIFVTWDVSKLMISSSSRLKQS